MTSTSTSAYKNTLSNEEIRKKLENYTKKPIDKIPIKTHVRYFSAIRDRQSHKIKTNHDGEPRISFKSGGFLKIKQTEKDSNGNNTGYVILRNKPVQDTRSKAKEWSVPVDPTTTFYAIKPSKSKDVQFKEKLNKQQEEINTLRSQLNKLSLRKSKKVKKWKQMYDTAFIKIICSA